MLRHAKDMRPGSLSGSLRLSLALYCSPNLLTKSLPGSQGPCSARSSATALHDFLKVWCAVCSVQGAACSSVCPVSCEVLAVWGVQCALCITKILPPSLLIVVWIHVHSGCADLDLLCFRAFLPDTHQPGRAPFHIFIVSKFTFLHHLGSIKASLYLPRRCALPSHI